MIKLDSDQLHYINIFSQLTKAVITDCLVTEGRIIFVVEKGNLGKAIGKNAIHLKHARRMFGKQVEVVEKADDIESFVRNLFPSIDINSMKITKRGQEGNEKYFITLLVNPEQRGLAIGRDGERIKTTNKLLKRYFNAEMRIL